MHHTHLKDTAPSKGLSQKADIQVIDGKKIAAQQMEEIRQEVRARVEAGGRVPGLAVVLVGHDPASEIYVRNKALQTHRAGMRSFMHMLPTSTTETELLALIEQLNSNSDIHGILVQLPLPEHIDQTHIMNAIKPEKDVDGLGEVNIGRVTLGLPHGIIPCTPLGCLSLLRSVHHDMTGMEAVIIGASHLVGRPMAQLLLQEKCTVSIAHIYTSHIEALACRADILIVATGKAGLVKKEWIKPGATIIDVGITRIPIENGKTRLIGDVCFDEVAPIAGAITPVPGGVGPMTISSLLLNTLEAAKRQEKSSP